MGCNRYNIKENRYQLIPTIVNNKRTEKFINITLNMIYYKDILQNQSYFN